MRKHTKYLVIFLLLIAFGCKKSEEQKPQDTTTKPAAATAKKKRGAPLPLEIYQEDKLVISLPPTAYTSVVSTKLKIGDKEFNGIALKDLLTKYNLKGKSVVLSGPLRSVAVSWQQATSKDVYVVIGQHQNLQISAPKSMNISFPARLIRIRASEASENVALSKENQKSGN